MNSQSQQMYKIAILGSTGMVGQQFISGLQNHPWFEVTCLAASKNSAGKRYIDAIKSSNGSIQWFGEGEINENIKEMTVKNVEEIDPLEFDIAYSALEAGAASTIESKFAEHIPVFSTASAYRYEEDVPILIPAVNDEHIALLEKQKKRGWKGFVAPQANCTTTGLVITLKPILDEFGIDSVVITSLQAVSGAGRSPGIPLLDLVDNIIPYIPKEEEKVSIELKKILGSYNGQNIVNANCDVSATCTRVGVLDGHTESVLVNTKNKVEVEDIIQVMDKFANSLAGKDLPSAPKKLITIHKDPFRPQPRLDRDLEDGMTTSVGRIRKDEVFPNGIKYVLLSHNTRMGAAKGVILTSEVLVNAKIIQK